MKNWITIAFIAISALAVFFTLKYSNDIMRKWKTSEANVKAYSDMLSSSEKKNAAFQLTVDQLKYFKDSILQELDNTRKQLKIKDKNLQSVQYVSSIFTKTDTLLLRDTVFRNPSLSLDTMIGDVWYKIMLGLKYPSSLTIHPEFKSEKHIIVSTKRETVNPPKKFFLFRWFQKKHTVLQVDVVEKNPYVKDENSRFIEIIK